MFILNGVISDRSVLHEVPKYGIISNVCMHVYIHTWNIEWNSQVNSSALCQSSLLLLGQLIKNNLQDQIPGDKKKLP